MPSKFSVTGLDFDDIFEARVNSVPTVAFGYKVNGLDISGRYELSAGGGSLNADQIPFNTNYKYNNVDLRYFFKSGAISIIISVQPQPDTVLETETGEFTIAATGTGTLYYQWQKYNNGTASWDNLTNSTGQIAGATSTTLQILNADYPTDEGSYRCVITDDNGSLNSNSATLTVNYLPVITTEPVSNIYNDDNAVSYTVVATEGKPAGLTYKWQRLTTNVGAVWTDLSAGSETDIGISYTTANLTFRCQLARADYQYRCIVSNSAGSDTSNAAILYINPKFNTGGNLSTTKSETVGSGQNTTVASFSVNVGGSAVLSYQWYKKLSGDPTFSEIGGDSSTFNETVDETSNNAQYYCEITSSNGNTTLVSNTCTLTVNLTAISITSFLGNGVANPTVNEDASLSYVVVAAGSGTLYYDFYRIDPGGNTLVQDSEIFNSNTYTHNVTQSENGKQFFCAVSSSKAGLTPQNTSPSTLTVRYLTITGGTINGINYLLSLGNTAEYTVTTSSYPAVTSYSWKKNGTQVSTASSYSFIVDGASAATYSVDVSNGFITKSASSILYIQPYITVNPSSATVDEGGSATFTVTAGGSFITYQWQLSTNSGGSWSDIGSANSTSYTVSGVTQSQDGYQYRCVISNSAPANNVPPYTTINAVSNPATLTVAYAVEYYFNGSWNLLPISGGSGSFSVNGGTLAGIKVLMVNYSTNTYTWQKLIGGNWTNQYGPRNGNLIPSENGDQVVWNPISVSDAGSWRCRISNALNGSPITSATFVITVIQYTLTVTNGTGGGTQNPGYTYTIVANSPSTGYSFSNWSVSSGSASIANVNSSTTTCTISSNATVVANYSINQYTLSVIYGTGGGTQNYGYTYTIVAGVYSGYTFSYWQTNAGSISYGNIYASTTTATIGAANATTEAIYTINQYTLVAAFADIVGGTSPYNGDPDLSARTANYQTVYVVTARTYGGFTFTNWQVNTGSVTYVNGTSSTSQTINITIGAGNASIEAVYV